MPNKTAKDAPSTLPAGAAKIWASALNAAWSGTCKKDDACAAKVAMGAVKQKFRQVAGGKWVPKAALAEVSLSITKATLQDDGTLRWQAVVSDTGADQHGEKTSIALFEDWIDRIETGKSVDFLPSPRMPFLGVSHYPDLDGYGEAGQTEKMYIDGNRLKVAGVFYSDDAHPLGKPLFEAIKSEQGATPDNPIRISAAWWDLKHSHGDFVFERKSLTDICPMCKGAEEKTYLAGQPDHWASTRVPVNPRTDIGLEEKSMPTTREQDAASIIDPELAEELERRATEPVEKSETPALVIKADDELSKIKDDIEKLQAAVFKGEPEEGTMPEETKEVKEVGLEASIEAILDNDDLGREAIIEAVQGKLNTYAESLKAEIDAKTPAGIAEQVEKGLGPMVERLDLLIAKMTPGQPTQAQPQQKSLTPGAMVPGQPTNELPISPQTGQPSALTAMINKSVGLQ